MTDDRPLKGANLVDLDDPALMHIYQAANQLTAFGFDVSDPEIAQRAIDKGRRDYTHGLRPGFTCGPPEATYPRHDLTDSVVYYMRTRDLVKIGFSRNIRLRLQALRPEELMATEPGGRTLERVRHREFRDLRYRYEWFKLAPPLTVHIENLRQQSLTRGRRSS